jgi:predicted HicB family RNase H-like nuclease
VRVAAEAASRLPPARVSAEDKPTTLNLRVRTSTVAALAAEAEARGLTMKQLVAQGLEAIGVQVAAADLEDRTPKRRT